ncbi:MAG: hypothetical protein KC646_04730 [Candidatus Cloacimonetes bacterium]|nr:hypothetical protein [Candidatus Cloacimonadota bacterium]
MYLPEFNDDSHVLFIGEINSYQTLYNKWSNDCHIITVVPRFDFAMRIMEESYFTDCLIDLDSFDEEDLRWFQCPPEIKSHAIAFEKKSLVLSDEIKHKLGKMYFFDETFDYDLQEKGYGLVQNKKSFFSRLFKSRSKAKKLLIRIILLNLFLILVMFGLMFVINLFHLENITPEGKPPNLSEKIENSFKATVESVEKVIEPIKSPLEIGSFFFDGDWDSLYDKTDMFSTGELKQMREQMDPKMIQTIRQNLSEEQKDALRERLK